MSRVDVQNLTKRFPTVTAVQSVSFSFAHGEFFVLLGPTGAGKTTTLRLIAGLERQDEGSILLDGEPIDGRTPAERDVAFVFQQYSLYPTMTVYDNLAFPLRSPLRKTPETVIKTTVNEAAEKLRITHLLNRKTAQLSGGEMQRVAIGRAIVRAPRLFLMDEPLSNLDAKLREALRVELKHLQKTQGSTTLFVTHDQIEALTMADRIAVLNEGRIVQQGTPDDIYDRPATTFVAQLVGTPKINLLPASRRDGKVLVQGSEISVPAPRLALPDAFRLGVRPEDVRPDPAGGFRGKVTLTEPLGVETILHLSSGETSLLSLVPGMAPQRVGEEIRFSIVQEKLHFFGLDNRRIAEQGH
jgi:multiple sugar transport system ATP-binding protein